MAIQTDKLVMATLGVVNDNPPNPNQPQPLKNGIHLRFAFAVNADFRGSDIICFGESERSGPFFRMDSNQ